MPRTLVKRHIAGRDGGECLDWNNGKAETGGFPRGHCPDSLALLTKVQARERLCKTNKHTNIQAGKEQNVVDYT